MKNKTFKQWSCSGGSTHLPYQCGQCGPGANPIVNTMVDFVVGSLLCSKSFFSRGSPVFPSPRKPTFSHSSLIRNQVTKELLRGCATSKSLLISIIHLFIYPLV